jgi:hypothetical protein
MRIPAPPRMPSFDMTTLDVRASAASLRAMASLRPDVATTPAARRRQALRRFVAAAERGIEVEELVAWLVRDYRPLCRRPATEDGIVSRRARAESVGEVAEEALAAARAALEMTADADTALDLALASVSAGHVVEVYDDCGVPVWCPVDERGMRLSERVRSLVACDVLDDASRRIRWIEAADAETLPPRTKAPSAHRELAGS